MCVSKDILLGLWPMGTHRVVSEDVVSVDFNRGQRRQRSFRLILVTSHLLVPCSWALSLGRFRDLDGQ